MPLDVSRILVVDDEDKAGTRISRTLWKAGYPVRFVHYDQADFAGGSIGSLSGVRIIFMDLDLIGAGITGDGSMVFTTVQGAINQLISDNNGPYVLVTWSSHDEYAERLLDHLNERLPYKKRPLGHARLNKEDFTGEHEPELIGAVRDCLQQLNSTACLVEWEGGIQYAACETVQKLVDIASELDCATQDDAVKKVLWALAQAEAGRTLDADNAMESLYSLLTNLLHDRVINWQSEKSSECGGLIEKHDCNDTEFGWFQKLNSMIHLETKTNLDNGFATGNVYQYPDLGHRLKIPELNHHKILRGQFMCGLDGLDTDDKDLLTEECKLLLVDITPPCDHAQKKAPWRKFVLAAYVPLEMVSACRFYNRENAQREVSRMCGDYLWKSPEFECDGNYFSVIFNSRVMLTMQEKDINSFGNPMFRVRQPLIADMIGWLARQSSRLGHVSL
jgi:CheY-like chemotaxis protein